MLIRTLTITAAAALLTAGAVATVAAPVSSDQPKVSIDPKTGNYCLTSDAVTGSRIADTECKSREAWQKEGVTFGHR
jgi:hypothetical protein